MELQFFTKKNCPLCEEALELIKELQSEIPFDLKEIDIYEDDLLLEKYQLMIPVVKLNGEVIDYGVVLKETVRQALTYSN